MPNNSIIIVCVLFGLLVVAFLGYFFYQPEEEIPVVSVPIAIPEPEPVPEPPVPEPETVSIEEEVTEAVTEEPAEELAEELAEEPPPYSMPSLDNSDQLIREGVVYLTRNEAINRWLGPNELIRKFVTVVDNLAGGQVAKDPVRVLAPNGQFTVRRISDELFILDEASYRRYDHFTEILVSLDTRKTAAFFLLLRPLLQEAFQELGYPDRQFDDVLFLAIGRMLETPVITRPIRLIRPVVMYEFQDPKLELLSAAQKQLIRMGPKNTVALQRKLREISLEMRSMLALEQRDWEP